MVVDQELVSAAVSPTRRQKRYLSLAVGQELNSAAVGSNSPKKYENPSILSIVRGSLTEMGAVNPKINPFDRAASRLGYSEHMEANSTKVVLDFEEKSAAHSGGLDENQ